MEAIRVPHDWPRFQNLLDKIHQLMIGFESCVFVRVTISANSIVRAIAQSVIRDGRIRLYMGLKGRRDSIIKCGTKLDVEL